MSKAKKITSIILLTIILIFLAFLIFIVINKSSENSDEKFINEITKMGTNVYSNYYYLIISNNKTEEEVSSYLKKFETIGLNFTLDEIEKYSEEYKEKINNYMDKNKNCSKEKSMIQIYPISPYSSKSFTSKVILDCVKNKKDN